MEKARSGEERRQGRVMVRVSSGGCMCLSLITLFFFHALVCQGEEVEALPQCTVEASSCGCSHSFTTPFVEAEIDDEDEGQMACAVWYASVYEKRMCVPVRKCVFMG